MLTHRVTNAIASAKIRRPSRLRILRACDVTLDDRAVSSRHVSIAPCDAGFDVNDLGSRNGTWLAGAKTKQAVVPPGSTLRLGTTLVQMLPAEEGVDIPPSTATSFGAMLGSSETMRRVFAVLERASKSDAPVLLLGESGTGKELAARAVHDASPRKDGPFVVFDCGAASEALVESTLFGHKRGAFTGAHADHPGAFALAHGGTLFLDEIGDLPLAMQPKLLRMLERGEVTPLGARKSESYDVRFVAATHRDLPADDAKDALLANFDHEYCTDLLRRAVGNLSQAARLAGLERKYLDKVLERAGLSPQRALADDD